MKLRLCHGNDLEGVGLRHQSGSNLDLLIQPFQLGYRRWLDGVRGVAILLVLAFHFQLIRGGSIGVDIFFVLSGFLITSLLAAEWQTTNSIGLKDFYIRRALRLLPAFALMLGMFYVVTRTLESRESVIGLQKEILVASLYVANWESFHHVPIPRLGATWSLSVEEQFYLIWPIAFLTLLKLKLSRKGIIATLVGGILLSASWRAWLLVKYAAERKITFEEKLRLYTGSDTRADALLVGCCLALILAWDIAPRKNWWRLLVRWTARFSAIANVYLAVRTDLGNRNYYIGLFTIVACMTANIFCYLLTDRAAVFRWVLESRPLVGAGKISYGLYLFHIPVIHWLKADGFGWRSPANTMRAAALTLTLAVASYFLLERPILKCRHRFSLTGRRNDASPSENDPLAKSENTGSVRAA